MSLYSISGLGCDCGNCVGDYIGGKKKRQQRKAKRQARRAKRKERKTRLYCKGARVKSVALSPARNAFLALIKINVKKLAVKLHSQLQNPERKRQIFQKWCKLGGNATKLESAVNKAYQKYARKKGIGQMGYMDFDGTLGVVSVATLIATASPILAALSPFLKQLAPEAAEIAEQAESVATEIEGGQEQTQEGGQEQEASGESVEGIGAMQINPWLIGGAAVAAYFIFKKRK